MTETEAIRQNYELGVMAGEAREQQRIIKLLEAECERPQDPKWSHYRESCYCGAIDLIKGEK